MGGGTVTGSQLLTVLAVAVTLPRIGEYKYLLYKLQCFTRVSTTEKCGI